MPTISLSMIVKNEEAILERAIASAARWVDEVVVVDTGSQDDSPTIAERCGARVVHHVWNGFSAARNKALAECTSDWILVLDADEELAPETAHLLKTHAQERSLTGFVCKQRNYLKDSPPVDVPVIRLFANDDRLRFSGLLHERVHCQSPEYKRVMTNIVINHVGASASYDAFSAKSRMYEDILRSGISQGDYSPEDLVFLGIILRQKGTHSEAVDALQKCIKSSLPSSPYLPTAFETLAVCFYEMGDTGKAEKTCKQGLKQFPDFPPLLYNMGLCHWRSGRYKDGRRCAKAAFTAAQHYTGLIPIDPRIRAGHAETLYRACHGDWQRNN